MESDYEIFRKRGSESLWRRLDQEYPKMPPADKNEVHRIISSQYSDPAGKSALEILEKTVYWQCRDSYRSLEENGSLKKVEIFEVFERVRDIMTSWRGDI